MQAQGAPIVIKADGLAAGKGVIIAETVDQAMDALEDMFGGSFGAAGAEVVIAVTLTAAAGGVLPLGTAQDHKRVGEGDTGPNTGGMGAYSPAPVMTPDVTEAALEQIVKPTMAEMVRRGTPYQGVLFVGLMIEDGAPRLVEYNVRFGDPECQVVLMRLMSDLLPALIASSDGVLSSFDLRWYDEAALTVVMAAKGYPGSYEKGSVIRGTEAAGGNSDDVKVFHAGTKKGPAGEILANGGRTVGEAQARAYEAVDRIDWKQGFCRRDIGWRAVGK